MSLWLKSIRLVVLALIVSSCTSDLIRLPNSSAPSYNLVKVQHLKFAAENGLLFQIPDSVFRDSPMRQIDEKCKSVGTISWPDQIYAAIEVFENNPKLLNKVHAVEIRRGDKAQAEISKDLDGGTYLTLFYAKSITKKKIENLSEIPCAEQNMDLLDKELSITQFEWPNQLQIASILQAQENKHSVERFNLDRRFLIYLANHMAILRLTPELSFEKNADGSSLLVSSMKILAEQVELNPKYPYIDYWMKEISSNSTIGHQINFFGIKRSIDLANGMQVDSAGKFSRKVSGHVDPTYPYLSFKIDNGEFKMINLGELNMCLRDLTKTRSNFLKSSKLYDNDPNGFLYPGHHCNSEEQTEN